MDLHAVDQWGYTPLFYVTRGGYKFTKPFLDKGYDVNALSPQGRTPLFWSISRGDLTNTSALLHTGADPSVPNTVTGNTPLIYATLYGNFEMVRTLVDAGARKSHKNYLGLSAGDYAVLIEREDIARLLK